MYVHLTYREIIWLILSVAILTVFPLLGASLLPVTSAVPVIGNPLLARDHNTTEGADSIAPSIVSFDFNNAEHNGNGKRSGLDSRGTSTSLSGLGGCLQQEVLLYAYAFPLLTKSH